MNDEQAARMAEDQAIDERARSMVRLMREKGELEAALDISARLIDHMNRKADDEPMLLASVVFSIGVARVLQIQTEIEAEGEGE